MAFASAPSTNETVFRLTSPATSGATAAAYSLAAYSLPAGTLKRAGQSVRITAWGTVGTNSNTKTLALRFGGVALNATASGSTSNGVWKMTALVTAQTPASAASPTQVAICDGYAFAAALAPVATALTANQAAAIVIDVLGTNGSASADCTVTGLVVEGLSD